MSSCSSPWRYEAQPRSTQIHTLYFHTKQPRWSPQLAAPLRPPQSPPRCTRARSSRLPRAPRNTAASASISHPRKKCMGRSALRPEHLSLRSGRPPDHRRLGQQLRRRGVLRDLRKLPGQVNQCLHLRAAGLWMTTARNPEASGRLQCGCFCHCCSCCASAIAVLAVLLPLLLLLFFCHGCSRCSSAIAALAVLLPWLFLLLLAKNRAINDLHGARWRASHRSAMRVRRVEYLSPDLADGDALPHPQRLCSARSPFTCSDRANDRTGAAVSNTLRGLTARAGVDSACCSPAPRSPPGLSTHC